MTLIRPGVGRETRQRIVVEGSRVASIGPTEAGTADAYSGMYVLPGLTDMHVHFPPAALPGQAELFSFLFLYHGVTAVRDAGDVDGTASEPARSGIAGEEFPGPRVFSCGPFVDGATPLWGNSLMALDAEQGRRAVETIAAGGWDCVKAYNGLSAEALAAVHATAEDPVSSKRSPIAWATTQPPTTHADTATNRKSMRGRPQISAARPEEMRFSSKSLSANRKRASLTNSSWDWPVASRTLSGSSIWMTPIF